MSWRKNPSQFQQAAIEHFEINMKSNVYSYVEKCLWDISEISKEWSKKLKPYNFKKHAKLVPGKFAGIHSTDKKFAKIQLANFV